MDHEAYHAAENAFIDGFRQAPDKLGFLCLARIPLELPAADGPGLKLLEVVLEDRFEVGRASPGFASPELVYHPLPGRLVTSRRRLAFRYVSLAAVQDLTLAEVLGRSGVVLSDAAAQHRHSHHHGSGTTHP